VLAALAVAAIVRVGPSFALLDALQQRRLSS